MAKFRTGTGNPAAEMIAAGVKPGTRIVVNDLPTEQWTADERRRDEEPVEVPLIVSAIGRSAVLVYGVRRNGGREFAYRGSAWGPDE